MSRLLKLAAIDIGSNSIKLVVIEAAASDSFAVLAREKEVVRLGKGTLREGFLAPDTIDRACDTLKRFRSIAEARGAERVIVNATASVREASNASHFIAEAEERAGVRVEVLSGIEEARLIGIAASEGCSQTRNAALINIDIGGGSTEISLMKDGVPVELYSLKLGAVGLTDYYLSSDPPKPKELRALRSQVRAAMERPARELAGSRWQHATGTSGTIFALGEVLLHRGLRGTVIAEQGAAAPGAAIVLSKLEALNHRLAGMTVHERRTVQGISAQRAEIVVAGGQILEGVMRALKINHLRSCDFALREGVVIDALRQLEAESRPPLPDTSDPRLRGVHAVGRRFGYEEAHAHQVARLAEAIFDALAADHQLTRHDRTLLSAAALLHDAGYHIAHDSHHKHSLYLIKHSELTGFSEAERDVIANVARYHRGAPPKERHLDFAVLNQQDRNTVGHLAAILRIADALDRSHDGRIEDARVRRDGDTLNIELISELDCEREVFAAEQKREMFEQLYQCNLQFNTRRKETADRQVRAATNAVSDYGRPMSKRG